MSGTSVDGVDVALIETDGERVASFGPTPDRCPIPTRPVAPIRAAFGATAEPGGDTGGRAGRHRRLHVAAVRALVRRGRASRPTTLDLVGFHGQTITHQPERRFTWQIGDGAALARALGVRVVNDLRTADVAAGGQGAPLVPVYHAALAARPAATARRRERRRRGQRHLDRRRRARCWPSIPARATARSTTGARVAPGSATTRTARWRRPARSIAAAWNASAEHRFFAKVPPKSLDRGDFNDSWADGLSVADGAATLTRGTARAIALASKHFPAPVSQWVICGGGRAIRRLLRAIAEETRGKVVTADDLGWDGDALEAQAFAFLAVRSLRGLPLTFPGTTGAPRPMTGGRLNEP